MAFEIIDFHTHPFDGNDNNICSHTAFCDMTKETTLRDFTGSLHISKICGSVLFGYGTRENTWEMLKEANDKALALRDFYGDFYEPGFHVHPSYIRESCEEVERMAKKGVKLCGELVPYWHGWQNAGFDYGSKELSEILDVCDQYGMIVSFHSMGDDAMDKMVSEHPHITFVGAHPGEYGEYMRHLERMKMSENYYVDMSGYGLFRHGMLRHGIDVFGAERFLFGSDFPTCNPAMYLGGILFDYTVTDAEKELILGGNAKRLLAR